MGTINGDREFMLDTRIDTRYMEVPYPVACLDRLGGINAENQPLNYK